MPGRKDVGKTLGGLPPGPVNEPEASRNSIATVPLLSPLFPPEYRLALNTPYGKKLLFGTCIL